MEMTFKDKNCEKKIYWRKVCKPLDHLPTVNIGTAYNNSEIMRNGKFILSYMANLNDKTKTIVFQKEIDNFKFYISYSKPGESLILKTPLVKLDEFNLQGVLFGDLKEGGEVGNEPKAIDVRFICVPFRKTENDVQILLEFNNYDTIDLYFKKICDNYGEIQEYFDILYVIYWILLILIIIFLIAIFFYYMKKNEITCMDIYQKTVESIQSFFSSKKKSMKKEQI